MAKIRDAAQMADFTEIVLPKYDGHFAVEDFSEGLAAVNSSKTDSGERKYGFIDKTGSEIISPEFISAGNYTEGFASVCVKTPNGKKTVLIDKAGRIVVPPKYDYIGEFTNGMARFYINKEGLFGNGYETIWGFIKRTPLT